MKPVTEMDSRGPGLRLELERATNTLPGARARARMYDEAGSTANPEYAESASAAYGIVAATVEASSKLIEQLDEKKPYWKISLPRSLAGEGTSPVCQDVGGSLYATYPNGRVVRLRGKVSDLRDFAMLEVEGEDGRSLGTGWVRFA